MATPKGWVKMPPALGSMVFVLNNPEEADHTPGHRRYRKMLKDDPEGFDRLYVKLEQIHARKIEAKRGKAVEVPVKEEAVEEAKEIPPGWEKYL